MSCGLGGGGKGRGVEWRKIGEKVRCDVDSWVNGYGEG